MVGCAVPQCAERTKGLNFSKSYFRFPKERDRCVEWGENIGRPDIPPMGPEYAHIKFRVCSLHFEQKMFTNNSLQNRLIATAVPTLYLPPSSMSPSEVKPTKPYNGNEPYPYDFEFVDVPMDYNVDDDVQFFQSEEDSLRKDR